MASDWLPFGTLGRPHGTQGELVLRPHNARASANGLPSKLVRLANGEVTRELVVSGIREVPGGYLVRFQDIADRSTAEAIVGWEVHVPRDRLAPLDVGEFYVEDLVGCDVVDALGHACGRVRGTFWNGAQDVMVVVSEDDRERFFPVVGEYVLRFDADRRQVIVDPHE
jgi:16S rRNA processing protein RimM